MSDRVVRVGGFYTDAIREVGKLGAQPFQSVCLARSILHEHVSVEWGLNLQGTPDGAFENGRRFHCIGQEGQLFGKWNFPGAGEGVQVKEAKPLAESPSEERKVILKRPELRDRSPSAKAFAASSTLQNIRGT